MVRTALVKNAVIGNLKLSDERMKQFSGHPAFLGVKAVMEGKAAKPDVKRLIDDSRAMFTGENGPEALLSDFLDNAKTGLMKNAENLLKDIAKRQGTLSKDLSQAREAAKAIPAEKKEEPGELFRIAEINRAAAELKGEGFVVERTLSEAANTVAALKRLIGAKNP